MTDKTKQKLTAQQSYWLKITQGDNGRGCGVLVAGND